MENPTWYCTWCGAEIPQNRVSISRESAVGDCDNDGIVTLTTDPADAG